MPIKTIIFDLGGVFIDIHFDRTKAAFERLGFADYAKQFNTTYYAPLFQQLETGHATPERFFEGVRQLSGLALSDADIATAWNAMLGAFRPAALALLEALRGQYRLMLFSNTNRIHYHAFMASYAQAYGGRDFNMLFEPAYYSHTLGLRKPHAASFTTILEKEGLLANQTLFIDDMPSNLAGAAEAGLHTLALPPGSQLEIVLPPYLKAAP
jgi:glucose-1-phosphatase